MALAGIEVEMWDRPLHCIVLSASPLDREPGRVTLSCGPPHQLKHLRLLKRCWTRESENDASQGGARSWRILGKTGSECFACRCNSPIFAIRVICLRLIGKLSVTLQA